MTQSGLALWRHPVAPPPRRAPARPASPGLPRGPAVSWGIALMLLAAIESRHATADLIEQYLPAAIPGFEAAPGVTVLSRSRPDYDPLGVPVGSFVVRPSASEATGFDSNPSGLPHARGSALFDTQASLQAASDWTHNSLGMSLTVDDTRYVSAQQDDTTNWSASAGGTLDIGRDQASWTVAHLGLNETPLDIDNAGIVRPIPYTVDDARVAYRFNFNRVSLEPAVDFMAYRFGSVEGVPSQTYRNRNLLQPSLTARYELAPLNNLVMVARGTDVDYLSSLPGQAKRNSLGFALLGGVELGTGTWQTRVLAGYQQRNYTSSQYPTVAGPIVEGSVSWTPTGIATFTGKLSRSIQDAADETVAAYTLTEADAMVDYEFRPNLLLHAQTTAQLANFSPGGNTTQLGGSLGATWMVNRTMTLSGTYTYTNSRSDVNSSYTDSLALLRLGLKL